VKRPVLWSKDALDDIIDQVAYIGLDNPDAAGRVVERVVAAGDSLGDMPTGRPGRVGGTYEKVVRRLPYIIAYAITRQVGGEAVSILRVIHTSRDWPDEAWPV